MVSNRTRPQITLQPIRGSSRNLRHPDIGCTVARSRQPKIKLYCTHPHSQLPYERVEDAFQEQRCGPLVLFASALDARVSNRGGCTVLRNLISYNLMPTCPQRCNRAAGHNSDGPDRKLMPGKSGIRVCKGLCTDDTDTLVRMRCTR